MTKIGFLLFPFPFDVDAKTVLLQLGYLLRLVSVIRFAGAITMFVCLELRILGYSLFVAVSVHSIRNLQRFDLALLIDYLSSILGGLRNQT